MALFGKNKTKDEKPKEQAETSVKETAKEKAGPELPAGAALPKGGDAHSYRAVLSPHVTEKGTLLGEHNKYIFKIAVGANKTEIKKAIENLYKVKVVGVHTSFLPSKYRRVGRFEGFKPGFKKATVTLKEGSKIDLTA